MLPVSPAPMPASTSRTNSRAFTRVPSRSSGRGCHTPGARQTAAMTHRAAVRLLAAPYDSGHRDVRMGAGPLALLRAGADERLRARGHAVSAQVVEPSAGWRAELGTSFELNRL